MSGIVDANVSNWTHEVLKSEVPTVVYFWHERCTWCARLDPVFNEITQEYQGKAKFVKFDILASQESRELAADNGVMGTPTLMFFCQGRSIGQTVSYMPKEDLREVLDNMLETYSRCLKQSSDLRNYVV